MTLSLRHVPKTNFIHNCNVRACRHLPLYAVSDRKIKLCFLCCRWTCSECSAAAPLRWPAGLKGPVPRSTNRRTRSSFIITKTSKCVHSNRNASFRRNFRHWLHRKMWKWQLPVHTVKKIWSKWWHFPDVNIIVPWACSDRGRSKNFITAGQHQNVTPFSNTSWATF